MVNYARTAVAGSISASKERHQTIEHMPKRQMFERLNFFWVFFSSPRSGFSAESTLLLGHPFPGLLTFIAFCYSNCFLLQTAHTHVGVIEVSPFLQVLAIMMAAAAARAKTSHGATPSVPVFIVSFSCVGCSFLFFTLLLSKCRIYEH